MLSCFREVKYQQSYRNYNILGFLEKYNLVAWWLAIQNTISKVQVRFPKKQEKNLIFNSNIKNFLLKAYGGETESLILLFF